MKGKLTDCASAAKRRACHISWRPSTRVSQNSLRRRLSWCVVSAGSTFHGRTVWICPSHWFSGSGSKGASLEPMHPMTRKKVEKTEAEARKEQVEKS